MSKSWAFALKPKWVPFYNFTCKVAQLYNLSTTQKTSGKITFLKLSCILYSIFYTFEQNLENAQRNTHNNHPFKDVLPIINDVNLNICRLLLFLLNFFQFFCYIIVTMITMVWYMVTINSSWVWSLVMSLVVCLLLIWSERYYCHLWTCTVQFFFLIKQYRGTNCK